MRFVMLCAALLIAVPSFAAEEAKPTLTLRNGVKVAGSTSLQYPLRIDNTLAAKWHGLFVYDLLHFDHTGINQLGKKTFPRNLLNNRVFLGYSVWKGLGVVYMRQDVTAKSPSNYGGVSWMLDHQFGPVKVSNYLDVVKGFNVPGFRLDEYVTFNLPLGFWVNDYFSVETGSPWAIANKVYVGYKLAEGEWFDGSVYLNQSVSRGRPSVYMLGFEMKFKVSR